MPTRRSPPQSPCTTGATRSWFAPRAQAWRRSSGSASPRRRSTRASRRYRSKTGRRARRSAPSSRRVRPSTSGHVMRSPTCRRRSRPSARISSGSTPTQRARQRRPRPRGCRGPTTCPIRIPRPLAASPSSARASPLRRASLRAFGTAALNALKPLAFRSFVRNHNSRRGSSWPARVRRHRRPLHRLPLCSSSSPQSPSNTHASGRQRAARRPGTVGAAGPRAGVAGRRGAPDRPRHRLDRVPGRRKADQGRAGGLRRKSPTPSSPPPPRTIRRTSTSRRTPGSSAVSRTARSCAEPPL